MNGLVGGPLLVTNAFVLFCGRLYVRRGVGVVEAGAVEHS